MPNLNLINIRSNFTYFFFYISLSAVYIIDYILPFVCSILACRPFVNKSDDDDKLIQEFLKKPTKDQNTNTSFTKALEEITANLIRSISISASAACSDQFCTFLSQVADLSVKYYRANPNIIRDAKSIIKPFNKNSMKISILEAGDKAFKEMLKALQNYKFVNLMINA